MAEQRNLPTRRDLVPQRFSSIWDDFFRMRDLWEDTASTLRGEA